MNDTSEKVLEELTQTLAELELSDIDEVTELTDYKWLYNQWDKVSPVLLGQLTDETQVEAFETADEYHQYILKSGCIKSADRKEVGRSNKQDIASIVSYKQVSRLVKSRRRRKAAEHGGFPEKKGCWTGPGFKGCF
ncbi:hypothetical protein CS542_03265 [Pedobacter sp. IW39]|nr:hypothetical protein CS542_03265 [Pedobacter sp. IW39]